MSRAAFVRRRGVDGERMDAACELADKRFVDHAVALEPALPAERLRHDIYPEMSLPALAMSSMPSVLVGFIHHLEARGGKSLGQLFRDEIAPCHGVRNSGSQTCRSMPATAFAVIREAIRKEGMAFCPAVLDRRVLTLDVARFLQALAERAHVRRISLWRCAVKKSDDRHRRLLRARRERPRS
jgi:hypothetical protein